MHVHVHKRRHTYTHLLKPSFSLVALDPYRSCTDTLVNELAVFCNFNQNAQYLFLAVTYYVSESQGAQNSKKHKLQNITNKEGHKQNNELSMYHQVH